MVVEESENRARGGLGRGIQSGIGISTSGDVLNPKPAACDGVAKHGFDMIRRAVAGVVIGKNDVGTDWIRLLEDALNGAFDQGLAARKLGEPDSGMLTPSGDEDSEAEHEAGLANPVPEFKKRGRSSFMVRWCHDWETDCPAGLGEG